MQLNFELDEEKQEARLTFAYTNFKQKRDYQEALGIITMVCGDFYIDPELSLEYFQELIESIKEGQKDTITFFISEDGLEAQIGQE